MKPLSGLPNGSLAVTVPLETAVLRKNRDLITQVHHTATEGIVVEMDVRKENWQRMLGLPENKNVYWADIRQINIRELSVMPWPITYPLGVATPITFGPQRGWNISEVEPDVVKELDSYWTTKAHQGASNYQ